MGSIFWLSFIDRTYYFFVDRRFLDLIGDTAYGTAEMLNWLVNERGIEPHIPVFDKSQHTDGPFSCDDFVYDHKRDCYICPAGKELRQRQKIYRLPRPLVYQNGMMRYRASKLDCQG